MLEYSEMSLKIEQLSSPRTPWKSPEVQLQDQQENPPEGLHEGQLENDLDIEELDTPVQPKNYLENQPEVQLQDQQENPPEGLHDGN